MLAISSISFKGNCRRKEYTLNKSKTQENRTVNEHQRRGFDEINGNYYTTRWPEAVLKVRNCQSNRKQDLTEEMFFVRMKNYKRDYKWANKMIGATYIVSMLVAKDADFDTILTTAQKAVSAFNPDSEKFGRISKTGHKFVLRKNNRGNEYYDRYFHGACSERKQARPNREYENANTCRLGIDDEDTLMVTCYPIHPKNLALAKKEYKKLKAIKNPSENQINRSVATINWLIAQEMPYERGNDSISSIITKGIYHAYDMKLSPVKQGMGLDFEAFDTDLEEYIKKYPTFFEKRPQKINQRFT